MSDQYLDEEEYLKSQLAELQRAYQKQAQPYTDRLTAIYALRPMPPVVIDLNELKKETSKYLYTMIGGGEKIETRYTTIDRDELKRLQADSEELAKLRKVATPSEDGGEVVTDIADLFADSKCAICGDTGHFVVDDTGPEYVTSPCHECNAPDAWRMFDGEGGYDYTHDEETAERWKKHCGEKYASWVEQLYLAPPTSAQHSRIVAAKDAEIERLDAGWHEANKKVLEASLDQPTRQMGGDADGLCLGIGGHTAIVSQAAYSIVLEREQAIRAALAPGAMVMPERKPELPTHTLADSDYNYANGKIDGYNEALDEVARLNRRAIPVELLKRVVLEVVCLEIASGLNAYATDELRALLGKEGE